jgi:hypothetical protein
MNDVWMPRRPVMTAKEFREAEIASYPRDYARSDDGYGDIEVARSEGWRPLSSWGADGWDLGEWPYVILCIRDHGADYELLSICEGDHVVYAFMSEKDRSAALDYLFCWYMIGKGLAETQWDAAIGVYDPEEARKRLDDGNLQVPNRFRGPYRECESP